MSAIAGLLAAELAREAAATRRVLERVPDEHLTWRVHPRSMSLGELALHVAIVPGAIADLLSEPVRELPTVPRPEAASRAEVLAELDASVARAADRLAAWSDEYLEQPWSLTVDGRPVMAMPRYEAVRWLLLNHWYHHRGQLTVYLRLLEVPVPGVYGPSADEENAAA